MKLASVLVSAFALMLPVSGAAAAQGGPGSTAEGAGFLKIQAAYRASDTCQAIVSTGRGAPPGVSVPAANVPVTVVVGRNPRGCGSTNIVRNTFRVGGGITPSLVEIFFVDPSGRLLKHEKVAVRSSRKTFMR